MKVLATEGPDLGLPDVMLLGLDGLPVCGKIRRLS
jgi:DNA-binding response OmpR family regulator